MGLLKVACKSTTVAHKGTTVTRKGTSLSPLKDCLRARAGSNHYFLVRPHVGISIL